MSTNHQELVRETLKRRLRSQGVRRLDDEDLEKKEKRQKLKHRDSWFEEWLDEIKTHRKLKSVVAIIVFSVLGIETMGVFFFTFLQATNNWNFVLENITFDIFLSATIIQISVMATIITRHLFPSNDISNKMFSMMDRYS